MAEWERELLEQHNAQQAEAPAAEAPTEQAEAPAAEAAPQGE